MEEGKRESAGEREGGERGGREGAYAQANLSQDSFGGTLQIGGPVQNRKLHHLCIVESLHAVPVQ